MEIPKDNYKSEQYKIADLYFEVRTPRQIDQTRLLPSFQDFRVCNGQETPVSIVTLMVLNAVDETSPGHLLSNTSEVWGDHFQFYETPSGYTTFLQRDADLGIWRMDSNRDFSHAVIRMHAGNKEPQDVLSWLLMLNYGQACLKHQAVLLHASVVECKDKAVAFLGPSGTGKSTHSKMWLSHIQGTNLLNDDNPAVRVLADGSVRIYGTPWSGKTPCYIAKSAGLSALVRIKQAKANQISPKTGMHALTCVLPSCTAIRWNRVLFNKMADTLEAIIQKVQIAELECLPDAEAAHICYKATLNT